MDVNIQEINERIQKESAFIDILKMEIGKVIIGQKAMVDRLLIGLLGNGHILLEGVPGLAKTTAIKTLAASLHATFHRIQFTPDLLPADLVGTMIYNQKTGEFQTRQGPVFANFILADEINRSPAKVQSALLEAMQERQVTIGDQTFKLPDPFLVMATQNPIEQEGTYPLPEAQLDRFLMEIDVDYPDRDAERRILLDTTGVEETKPRPAMNAEDLLAAQRLVRRIPVGQSVIDAILSLVRSARPGDENSDLTQHIAWGPSPRASQALMLSVRARALLDGRLAPSVDDVIALAEPVLKHRMALTYAARADGETITGVIGRLKERVG